MTWSQIANKTFELHLVSSIVGYYNAQSIIISGEFDNAGAMMSVDETLMCSFQILKPADKRKFQYNMNAGRPVTPPRGATNKNKKK